MCVLPQWPVRKGRSDGVWERKMEIVRRQSIVTAMCVGSRRGLRIAPS